jgi:hypothetical protein
LIAVPEPGESVSEQRKKLPDQPGVLIFADKAG